MNNRNSSSSLTILFGLLLILGIILLPMSIRIVNAKEYDEFWH